MDGLDRGALIDEVAGLIFAGSGASANEELLNSLGYASIFMPRDGYGSLEILLKKMEVYSSHVYAGKYAGLGTIGYSHNLLNPMYGPRARYVYVLTSAAVPGDAPIEKNLCKGCRLCGRLCPAQATRPVEGSAIAELDAVKCTLYHPELAAENRWPCGIWSKVCAVGEDRKLYGSTRVRAYLEERCSSAPTRFKGRSKVLIEPNQCRVGVSHAGDGSQHGDSEFQDTAQNHNSSSGKFGVGSNSNSENTAAAHFCTLLNRQFVVGEKILTRQIGSQGTSRGSGRRVFPEPDRGIEKPVVGRFGRVGIEGVNVAAFRVRRSQNGKQPIGIWAGLVYGFVVRNPHHKMSGTSIGGTRLRLGEDVALAQPERLCQRPCVLQWIEETQWRLAHTSVNPATDFFKFDRQDVRSDLLMKGPRGLQSTEITMLSKPEPGAESIVPRAENFCAACGERP